MSLKSARESYESFIDRHAPVCHFRKMFLDEADSTDYHTVQWWECSVCGHTKDIDYKMYEEG
jgi:rubredoxin